MTPDEKQTLKDLREALRLIDEHGSDSSTLLNISSKLAEYIRYYKAERQGDNDERR